MNFGTYISYAFSIIAIILVLIFTYYGSRWLVKRYSFGTSGKHIRIIDRAFIGKDKCIILADICGETYILGAGSGNISLIKCLGKTEIPEDKHEEMNDLFSVISTMIKKRPKNMDVSKSSKIDFKTIFRTSIEKRTGDNSTESKDKGEEDEK